MISFVPTRRLLIRANLLLNICVLTYVALQAAQRKPNGDLDVEALVAASVTKSKKETSPSTGSDVSIDSEKCSLQQSPITARLDLGCNDRDNHFSYTQRGAYWVLNNYVPAKRRWGCDESITYTTHGEVTFLDNVVPLAKRWDGPISMSVYTPGADYEAAIKSISYLRQCTEPEVSEKVTFHLVLNEKHFPAFVRKLHPEQGSLLAAIVSETAFGPTSEPFWNEFDVEGPATSAAVSSAQDNKLWVFTELNDLGLPVMDCALPAPWTTAKMNTYRQIRNLMYPVNLLRNVARMNAGTHYILASDAELYPSLNLIPTFISMIRRNDSVLHNDRPKVFVLPVFEVYANQTVPSNKAELITMLESGMGVPFHQKVCSPCHLVPKIKEWLIANITDDLHVFHVAKRHKLHYKWEPFYIGTHSDPLFDERLTWEGRRNKMQQAYALCLLDYDFMILDNAFLVHRPGVKVSKPEPVRDPVAEIQSAFIDSTIYRELEILYGYNPNCVL